MDDLRRLTVRVLLAVLVITVIGEFIDAWFFHNQFDMAIPIITLVGGMVSGLFAPELLRSRRGGETIEKKEAVKRDDIPIPPTNG